MLDTPIGQDDPHGENGSLGVKCYNSQKYVHSPAIEESKL